MNLFSAKRESPTGKIEEDESANVGGDLIERQCRSDDADRDADFGERNELDQRIIAVVAERPDSMRHRVLTIAMSILANISI